MPSPFASVTKVAIEEMIREHTTASKFGFFLSQEAMDELIGELVRFMATSRNLKSAGDRLLQQTTVSPAPRSRPMRHKSP